MEHIGAQRLGSERQELLAQRLSLEDQFAPA